MICGAEACNLGVMIHGVEFRVHFLKSFQKESTCENLSQKGLKQKNGAAAAGTTCSSTKPASSPSSLEVSRFVPPFCSIHIITPSIFFSDACFHVSILVT
jgi:hypothetical protein